VGSKRGGGGGASKITQREFAGNRGGTGAPHSRKKSRQRGDNDICSFVITGKCARRMDRGVTKPRRPKK